MDSPPLARADVVALAGDLPDETVAAIIATGASVADLEAALQFLAGADDAMGEERIALTGARAAVYDILADLEPEADR